MLKIRLHRTGKTKRPYFRVVVAEHRRAAQGPYISALGFWDPIKGKLTLNEEELKGWLTRGARPTDRISRLLKKEGMKHKLIVIHERPARGPKSPKDAEEKATQKVAEEAAPAASADEKKAESVESAVKQVKEEKVEKKEKKDA